MKPFILLAATTALMPSALLAQTYTIQSGDTLRSIAGEVYGQTSRWRELCDQNGIRDCDRIEAGAVLQLAPDARVGDPAPTPTTVTAEADTPTPEPAPSETSATNESFAFDLSDGSDVALRIPDGLSVDRNEQGAFMRGQPVGEANSFGPTAGISLAVGSNIEATVSGKNIRVDLDVIGSGPFQVAYSTNDVGNSAWRTLNATPTPQTVSFTYTPPPLNNGNDDFIGILPDTGGTGESLLVSSIRIVILGD